PLLRDAVAKCRKRVGNEHEDTATLLYNLACLLMDQGDYSAAESLYRETLAIRRKQMGEDSPRVASCLKALATLLYRKGDYEAGEPILQEALEMNRRRLGEDHLEIASNRKSLASFRRQKGDYGGAIELLNLAIPSLVRILGEEHPKVAAAYDALGCCLGSQHRYAEAEVDFARALEMFRKLLGEEHPKVAMVLNDMAINDLAQGRYQEAETAFKQAADVFETARLRAGEGLTRARFQESPYTRLAATRLRLGDPMGAWRAAERGLGRALADLLIATGQRTLTPFEIATQDSLNGELGRLERQLEALGKTCETDSTGEKLGEFNEKRTQLLYTEAAWSAFQRGIASRYPVTEGQVFPLERIQRGLDDETAILGWLHTEMEEKTFDSWGYLIRHSGPVTWIEIKGADDVVDPKEPTAFDFHEALIIAASWPFRVTEVERIEADAQAICERWIDPFSECLTDIKNLVIIPTGPMLGIPIEALKDHGGRFIGDRYAVSYAPSATIYTWLQEMGKRNSDRPSHKALLVGDPPFTLDQLAAMENQEKEPVYFSVRDIPVDLPVLRGMLAGNQEALASLPRLPGTREEVKRVASVLPDAMTLIGPDATEQEIVDLASSGALGEFDLLHFATHTLMDDEQPERSALVLSLVNLPDPLETTMEGKRIYDGLVTLEEIVREWDLEADLVVLSGCQTALGGKMAGEGFIGLAYAVLQAGARSVLVSLWRVEDTATSLLMGRFYENLTNSQRHRDISGKNLPMNKAEALGEAKQWLRNMTDAEGVRPFQHPTYWSSFILIGER
ncbi:MAG: CHAT domain-containing protein, partial [Candidatus Eisenbacteria bacterium]|nr:CHAT domain-containing protein [Candidatus Eisenbacteria bacterium]